MKISRRETVLALITVTVALYGGTAMVAGKKAGDWRALRRQQAEVAAQIEQDRALTGERSKFEAEAARLGQLVKQHPAGEKVDVYWLRTMEELAIKHGVRISKRQPGEEKRVGDVFEMLIECKEWEAPLDALIWFLFDLQSHGAMLDVRQLYAKPKDKNVLGGRFSLYCAYMRLPPGKAAGSQAEARSRAEGTKP